MKSGIPDRRRTGRDPDIRPAAGVGRLAIGLAGRCGREPEQFGIRDRGARGLGPILSRGNQNHALFVDQQDFSPAHSFPQGLVVRELLKIERGEQDEFQRRAFRPYGICDLQHRYPRQPAERRLQRDHSGRELRLLEIVAIPEIEAAVALQRVAEQAAVGIDGQYTGKLRIFLAHGGKEGRTRRSVPGVEVAGAGQTVMQLRRALDFLVEVVRNIIGRCRQVDQGGVDFAGAVLQEAQPDEASRHQHGDDHQYQ